MAATLQTSDTSVTLTYYAHCAFLWHTPQGVRVLTDPYRNRHDRYWFTREFPPVECDLALITHTHFDHDATDALPETASVIRMPGEFRYRDLHVRGVLDKHSGRFSKGMDNIMFRLEIGGLRFLHIGDNYIDWPAEVATAIGDIDVLLVTVDDSCHLLTYDEVDTLITAVNPRVVVPMHYLIPELMPVSTTLRTLDEWVTTRPQVRHLGTNRAAFHRDTLPTSTEVWVFEPSPEVFTTPPVAQTVTAPSGATSDPSRELPEKRREK